MRYLIQLTLDLVTYSLIKPEGWIGESVNQLAVYHLNWNWPENGAGERLLLEPEGAPDLCEWRHEDAEAEGPGEGDHEEDVGLRVYAAVVGVAGDQHIPAIGQLEYNDKHV